MKYKILAAMVLLLAGISGGKMIAVAAAENPTKLSVNPEIQTALRGLNLIFTEKMVLGKPLEVQGLTLVPVATVGLGFGSGAAPGTEGPDRMAIGGGIASPAGVIVISKRGVQMLPIKRGFMGEIMAVAMPTISQVLRDRQTTSEPSAEGVVDISSPLRKVGTQLFQMLLQNGFRFGFFPWPLGLIAVFLVGWLGLTLFIGTFVSESVAVTAQRLSSDTLRAGLTGLLAAILVLILAGILLVSVIGIPLMLILFFSAGAAWLLGMTGVVYVIGEKLARGLKRETLSLVSMLLIGGVVLGAVRVIPIIGWIVWLLIGLIGFGAVLLTKFGTGKPWFAHPRATSTAGAS